MNPDMKERIEKRREELYRVMKEQRPDLYEAAIRVGHMAMTDFCQTNDETKRAAIVEIEAMSLAAHAAGIVIPLPSNAGNHGPA